MQIKSNKQYNLLKTLMIFQSQYILKRKQKIFFDTQFIICKPKFSYILLLVHASAHFYVNSTFNSLTIQSIIMSQIQKKPISMTNNQLELAKKLQILQNENRILQQSKDSIQSSIRRLVDDVNTRDQQLQQKAQQNQQLARKNKELSTACRKLELQNQRLNQQYTSLYNYSSQQRKRGSRELVIKEMQLTNRLNEIQYQGYEKVIEQLKQTLQRKNVDISILISQNGKLKKELLTTTYQFHDQIYTLKEQITALKAEATAVMLNPVQNTQAAESLEILSSLKIQNMQKELNLYQKQYSSISKQLLQCKRQLHQYKHEAEWLQAKLQKREPVNRAQFDYDKARQLMDQNNTLRKEIQHQKLKMIRLLEDNPQLMQAVSEIDVSNPLEQLQLTISQLRTQLQIKTKDINKLKENLQRMSDQKIKTDQDLFKTRAKTIKVVEKLKGIFNKYIPCFNFYGFGEFGLDQQQCKFLDENSAGMEKQYDKMCNQLTNKKAELRKLQSKIKELDQKLKNKDERIELLTKNDKQLHQENEKLMASLQALTKKTTNIKIQKNPKQQHYSESQELPEIIQSEPQEDSSNNSSLQQQQRSNKVQNLMALVSELQQERQKCLLIIRSKDVMLAEANAQISILKSQSIPKVYNFNSILQLPSMRFQQPLRDKSSIDHSKLLQTNSLNFEEFKEALNNLSQNYQNEIRLTNEQFNKKYSALDVKYTKLLNEYSNFQEQYSKLENAYEESVKKIENQAKRIQIGEIQQENNQQIENSINIRDDNNSINQSTIQTINQLLKKYQKEFNRFTNLYQSEMVKVNQLKQQSFTSVQTHTLQQHFTNQIERVESILKQNQQTITLLEKELREKEEQLVSEREHFEKNEQISDQRLAHLEMRCNQLNSQLQSLQRKVIEQNNKQKQSSVQQSAVLIAILTSKNNQISSLKEKLIQKQTIIEQSRKDLAILSERKTDELSQLQLEEFRAFKNYLQQNDLYSLLQNIQRVITQKSSQEHQ